MPPTIQERPAPAPPQALPSPAPQALRSPSPQPPPQALPPRPTPRPSPPPFLLSFLFGIASPKVHFERNRFPSSRRCNLVFHFEDMMVKEKFGDLITVEGLGDKGSSAPSQGDWRQASFAMTAEHKYARQLLPCDTNGHTVRSYSYKHTHTYHTCLPMLSHNHV